MPPPTVKNISINIGSASTQSFPNSYSLLKLYEDDFQTARQGKGSKIVYGLPVPKGANDIHEHDWAALEVGALGAKLQELFGAQGYQITEKDVAQAASLGIQGALGLQGFIDLKFAAQGRSINPYTQLAYKSPALRQFQFSWSLVSTSPADAQQIRSLVSDLRQTSYPTPNGPLFKYPSLCQVEVVGRPQNGGSGITLIRTQPSAITSVQISYDTQGGLYVHRTGHPVTTTITISLQETKLLDARNVFDLYRAPSDS